MPSSKDSKDSDPSRFAQPYRFECSQCGKCCSDPDTIVNTTAQDILRIKKITKSDSKDLLDIIGFYIFEEEITKDQLKKMVFPPIKTERGYAFVGLRKDPTGRCIFLGEGNKCRIYAARPSICRTFPFHFLTVPKKEPKPHLTMEMTLAQKGIEYCPSIGSPSPVIDPKNWLKIGEKAVKAIIYDHLLVKKWNEAVNKRQVQAVAENFLKLILTMENSRGDVKSLQVARQLHASSSTSTVLKKDGTKTQSKKNYRSKLKDKLKDKDSKAN